MSGPSGRNKAPGFILRGLSPEQLAEVDRAARESGKTRSEWARERLIEAARSVQSAHTCRAECTEEVVQPVA